MECPLRTFPVDIGNVILYAFAYVNTRTEPYRMRYAVKIGEVVLRSDQPLTEEQRSEAVRRLERLREILLFEGTGYEAVGVVSSDVWRGD